jgi:hypothetical protein
MKNKFIPAEKNDGREVMSTLICVQLFFFVRSEITHNAEMVIYQRFHLFSYRNTIFFYAGMNCRK